MTTVSLVAQLTAVSNSLTRGHQICCWDGCIRPFSFLPELFNCCWPCAVHSVLQVTNPTRKIPVGLNMEIVGVINRSSASYPSIGISVVKMVPDITMVTWGFPRLGTTCPHLHTADERWKQWILEVC